MLLVLTICLSLATGFATSYPGGVSVSAGSTQVSDGHGGVQGTTYTSNGGGAFGAPNVYGPGFAYQPPFAAQQQAAAAGLYPQQPVFPAGFGNNFAGFPQPPIFPSFQPQLQFTPLPPLLTPSQFSEALNQYVAQVQQQYSSIYQQQQKQWEEWKNNVAHAQQQAFAQQSSGNNVATATGSIGPNGVHQSASLHPENPAQPNIETRFDASGGPGFVGVSTSSFSSSSDVNGVKTQRKGAITTVNDNGKITTYKLDS